MFSRCFHMSANRISRNPCISRDAPPSPLGTRQGPSRNGGPDCPLWRLALACRASPPHTGRSSTPPHTVRGRKLPSRSETSFRPSRPLPELPPKSGHLPLPNRGGRCPTLSTGPGTQKRPSHPARDDWAKVGAWGTIREEYTMAASTRSHIEPAEVAPGCDLLSRPYPVA